MTAARPRVRLGPRLLAAAPLLLVGLACGVWMLGRLDVFEFGTDEGPYLMWARLARQGYPMYSAIWSDHPPLIVWTLLGLFRVWGESITPPRILAVLVAVAGLLAVGGIAWSAAGRWAGVAAALFLALAPLFNWYGRAIMPDGPANSLAAIALFLALRPRVSPRLAALSGLVFGASLMVKLVTAPLAPVVLLALLTAQRDRRQALVATLAWGGAVLAVVALVFAPVQAPLALRLIVETVGEAREAKPWEWQATWEVIQAALVEGHLGLLAPAVLGLAACLTRRSRSRLVVVVWTLVGLAAILFQSPLFDHHLALVLFPLAVLAGLGVAHLGAGWGWRLAAVGALLFYAWQFPTALDLTLRDSGAREAENWRMLDDIQALTEPGDWIVTDNVVLAFRAGLRVPPFVAYPGAKRLTSGLLPDEVWVRQTAQWQPRALVFVRTAGQSSRAAFLNWVDHTFRLAQRYAATRRVWTPGDAYPIIHLEPQPLQDGITFEGYSLAENHIRPGGKLHVGLFFAAPFALNEDYRVAARLLAADGRVVADSGSAWVNPSAEKWRYARGDWTLETRTLDLPTSLPPGPLTLEVGLTRTDGTPVGAPLRLAPLTIDN